VGNNQSKNVGKISKKEESSPFPMLSSQGKSAKLKEKSVEEEQQISSLQVHNKSVENKENMFLVKI
jgi:hypothetical protein